MICIFYFKKKTFWKEVTWYEFPSRKISCNTHNTLRSLFSILISGKMQTGDSHFHFKSYRLLLKETRTPASSWSLYKKKIIMDQNELLFTAKHSIYNGSSLQLSAHKQCPRWAVWFSIRGWQFVSNFEDQQMVLLQTAILFGFV